MNNTLQFRKRLVAWMINKAVPALNIFRYPKLWPYTLKEMRKFPKGSLGFEMAAFLDKRKFDLLPKYEIHDAVHTILNYNTTTVGELRLQAFMWGNGSSSYAGRILFLIGLLTLPELWRELRLDYERGKKAAERIDNWDIAALINRDLTTLRLQLEPNKIQDSLPA
jgi:ubiquinone biosynthesis protein Coq4